MYDIEGKLKRRAMLERLQGLGRAEATSNTVAIPVPDQAPGPRHRHGPPVDLPVSDPPARSREGRSSRRGSEADGRRPKQAAPTDDSAVLLRSLDDADLSDLVGDHDGPAQDGDSPTFSRAPVQAGPYLEAAPYADAFVPAGPYADAAPVPVVPALDVEPSAVDAPYARASAYPQGVGADLDGEPVVIDPYAEANPYPQVIGPDLDTEPDTLDRLDADPYAEASPYPQVIGPDLDTEPDTVDHPVDDPDVGPAGVDPDADAGYHPHVAPVMVAALHHIPAAMRAPDAGGGTHHPGLEPLEPAPVEPTRPEPASSASTIADLLRSGADRLFFEPARPPAAGSAPPAGHD
jgi:hypothetical protein